jgi:hypothetical protein
MKETATQKKTIGNVNILDLRHATEASVAGIERIGNVNIVLYTRETAGLLAGLDMGNVNNSIEVPAEAQVVTGKVVINDKYFAHQETPLSLVVIGQVLVEPDVPAEDVEKGLGELHLTGQLVCPEHLAGLFQARTPNLVGSTAIYAPGGRLVHGSLTLDESYLQALDDGSQLVVLGSLRLPQVLPNELLARKIQRVQAKGGVRCHEANAPIIQARLAGGSGRVTVIPDGFELVARPLVLDAALLQALPSTKLYCTERVQIALDVEPALLDERLERLVCQDIVLCPAALKGALAQKCNLLETQAVFYEGELWLINDDGHLAASRFDYLAGNATLVVLGTLEVAPDIAPQVLAERLDKVHNLGMIECTPEQMGALQARLGLSEGVMETSAAEKKEGQIGNVNQLVL